DRQIDGVRESAAPVVCVTEYESQQCQATSRQIAQSMAVGVASHSVVPPSNRCGMPVSKQLSASKQAARQGVSLMGMWCASGNRCHLPIGAQTFEKAVG